MGSRILLVGMMGVGKSTVGRALAARLGYPYFDSDEQVMHRTGRTVPELFAERGEAAFRAEEKQALADAFLTDGPAVVSVAGGAVVDPDNRRLLSEGGTVVWLRAGLTALADRIGDGAGRPLLDHDPASTLPRIYEQRRPLYEGLADIVVDVDHLSPEQAVKEIIVALQLPVQERGQ